MIYHVADFKLPLTPHYPGGRTWYVLASHQLVMDPRSRRTRFAQSQIYESLDDIDALHLWLTERDAHYPARFCVHAVTLSPHLSLCPTCGLPCLV